MSALRKLHNLWKCSNISYHEKQRVFWNAEKGELTGDKGPVDVYWPGGEKAA
jgi:hypothetical protein